MRAFLIVTILLLILTKIRCDVTTRIKNGLVRGFTKTAYYGRKYTSFEGIRYGEPPVNHLRYRHPVPIKNWKGVFIANETIECAQVDPYTNLTKGQEDCLSVNVYVPKEQINGYENLDVVVFFQSGGYYFSSSFGPEILMERDIIVVMFNHRLNYLGFMSFGDKLVPGNYGMKDQVLVLKWVQRNIKYFGGNPNSVTLMGLGGGSSSVQHHYLSPLSKGLFHRTFIISGSVLNPYAFHLNSTRGLSDYLREMGCERNSNKKVLRCLQEADLEKTLISSFKINEQHSPRASTIHVEADQLGAFLLEEPEKLLREGKVHQAPQVILMSLSEGLIVSGLVYNQTEYVNKEYKALFPKYFQYSDTSTKDRTNELIKEYLGEITQENYKKFTDLLSVRIFGYGMHRSAKYLANTSSCYFGLMSYKGENSMMGSVTKAYSDLGVGHGDTIPFFMTAPNYTRLRGEDVNMSKLLVDSLVNFAKTGTAQIDGREWIPVSKIGNDKVDYVNFKSPENFLIESNDIRDEGRLLDKLSLVYQ